MEPKVIIVTGASRGIGLAVAQCLLAAQHKTVLISRSAEKLQELKQRCPAQVAYVAADMAAPDVSEIELLSSFLGSWLHTSPVPVLGYTALTCARQQRE